LHPIQQLESHKDHTMARLPLLSAFVASCFLCAVAQEGLLETSGDIIKTAADALTEGAGLSDNATKQIKDAAKKVDEILQEAEKKMLEITEKIGSLGVQSNKITKEAFDKYDAVKKSLRLSRRELRKLADKTRTACEELEDYLAGWDNTVDNGDKKEYLKLQLTIMEDLMKESLELLKKAEGNYEQAISDIVAVNGQLRDFHRGIKKMLDTNSEEHEAWAAGVRGGAYGTATSVTIGLIVADALGCLGICSLVGNAIGWGTAVVAAEVSIAEVEAEIEVLEALGENVKKDISDVKARTDKLIKLLEREVDIIGRWSNNAKNLDKKLDRLDLSKFEKLPLYRDNFSKALVRLRESAEEYLAQPEQLWEDEETPTQNRTRKRRDLAFLTRSHPRRF